MRGSVIVAAPDTLERMTATFAELLAHPDVVDDLELRSPVGLLALHGGLEPGTAEIAAAAAARSGASCYTIRQPDDLNWHVPSHLSDPGDAPGLASFLAHVDVVVSVHGYWGRPLRHALLLGGADRVLATDLAGRLRAALPRYTVVDDLRAIPRHLRGLDPRNPVNRTARGGVQLELPHPVRAIGPYGRGAAAATHRSHTVTLIAVLAEFASAFGERTSTT